VGTPGVKKVGRYGDQFKATAVALSHVPGVLVKDVAEALDIHPFMLSLWRKQVRDGVIVAKPSKLDPETKAELKRQHATKRRDFSASSLLGTGASAA
jgi:transposase